MPAAGALLLSIGLKLAAPLDKMTEAEKIHSYLMLVSSLFVTVVSNLPDAASSRPTLKSELCGKSTGEAPHVPALASC
jgi:hypothetical protein